MRNYEQAMHRLEKLTAQLTGDAQAGTLSKINVVGAPGSAPEIHESLMAISNLVREDLPKYVSRALIKAQDDVQVAADALRDAIDADLKSNIMRD